MAIPIELPRLMVRLQLMQAMGAFQGNVTHAPLGAPMDFDVTVEFLDMAFDYLERVKTWPESTAEHLIAATPQRTAHHGPARVTWDLDAWLAGHGFARKTLTREQVLGLREKYTGSKYRMIEPTAPIFVRIPAASRDLVCKALREHGYEEAAGELAAFSRMYLEPEQNHARREAIARAREVTATNEDLGIDDDAAISEADTGVHVLAWVWVPYLAKDVYPDGECPSCHAELTEDVVVGGECPQCEHILDGQELLDDDEASKSKG